MKCPCLLHVIRTNLFLLFRTSRRSTLTVLHFHWIQVIPYARGTLCKHLRIGKGKCTGEAYECDKRLLESWLKAAIVECRRPHQPAAYRNRNPECLWKWQIWAFCARDLPLDRIVMFASRWRSVNVKSDIQTHTVGPAIIAPLAHSAKETIHLF